MTKLKEIELFVEDFSSEENVDTGIITISGYANRYIDEDGSLIIDRSTESVLPSGYDLKAFKKNPILLYQHDKSRPIGKIITVELRADGLYVEANVHKMLDKQAHYAVQHGILKTFSIGFAVKDYTEVDGVYFWTEIELHEISIVSVPDNQESLFTVLTNSPCDSGKCVLSSKATPKTNKEDIKKITWADTDKTEMLKAVAEFGNDLAKDAYLMVKDIDNSSTWKFPHHAYDKETNTISLVKEGLDSALSALKGAKDDEVHSLEDKTNAVAHLEKHYSELLELGTLDNIPEDLNELVKYFEEKALAVIKENDATPADGQPEGDVTINTPDEPENGGKDNQNPAGDPAGADDGKPDGDRVISIDDVSAFIAEASKSSDGLDTLLGLYAGLEASINEALPKLLEQE